MTLADLEEVLGVAGAQALIALRGGQQVRIPRRPVGERHWLAALGAEAVSRLIEQFPGRQFEVPVGRVYKTRAQQKRLIGLYEEGLSLNQIAQVAKLHRRTVANHIGKPLNPDQTSFLED